MNDDTAILLFLAVGALVLIGIIVFGVLSSRRKKNATTGTWTVSTGWIGEQPFLESSDLDIADKRQEELFRQTYPIGGSLTISGYDEDGQPNEREVHVSRIGRSLRVGYPQAKLGLTAYFREWDGSEFPVAFPVKGSDKITEIAMDADGVTARDVTGEVLLSAPWSAVLFSNGRDMMLAAGTGKTLRFEYADERSDLEELLIKYGTLKQMHF